MMRRCSAPDPGAIYSHVSSWGSGGWLGGFSPAVAWPVTGPGNRQRAGRGTAWCLGQGLAQILQCQAGPSLHGDHQPHNCDTGQYQCSETRTVCVSLCGIAFTLSINDTILNRHLNTRRFYRQTYVPNIWILININCKCQNWRPL